MRHRIVPAAELSVKDLRARKYIHNQERKTMTASMQRLEEGKSSVSPKDAQALQALDKEPRKRKKPLPVRFKKTQVAHDNPFGVTAGQLWESRDERVKPPRQLRVIDVGDEHAVMENVETGRRTTVQLRLFKPTTKRGFRLVSEES